MENIAKTTLLCSGCRLIKPINEFMGFEAKQVLKQFHTCNNCRNRTTKQHMNMKKRQIEIEENEEFSQENSLEIIEPDNFCDYIAELISTFENDTENIPYFHFQCEV